MLDQVASPCTAVGCISFLNTKPLIHGIERYPAIRPVYDVPSGLLDALENDRVALALCPVIDLQTSRRPLMAVPVGGIACHGKTLTVRLFSRVDWSRVQTVHADSDSHTSVMLMRLIMAEVYGRRVAVQPLGSLSDVQAQTLLLIGDKVITSSPSERDYPYQLDLGQAWLEHTQLPFVFAIWQAVAGMDLGDAPRQLNELRQINAPHRQAIAAEYAPRLGWPVELARQYLSHWMQYELTDRHFQAVDLFFSKLHRLDWLAKPRAIQRADVR